MKTKVQVFQNDAVEHDLKCHAADCFVAKPHRKVFYFETEDTIYYAHSIDKAARMWVNNNYSELVAVGSSG